MARDLNLKQLINLGGDQIMSQYIIRFIDQAFFASLPGMPAGFTTAELSLRFDQAFDLPKEEGSTYDIFFQGLKATKTGILDASTKEFTLNIRLDDNWLMYKAMKAWKRFCFDPIQGRAAPEPLTRTTMDVDFYGAGDSPTHTIRFSGVKLKSIKGGSYDPSSGDPTRIDCDFTFYFMDDIDGGVQR